MTVSDEDVVTAISRINELTRDQMIKWHPSEKIRLGDSIGYGYQAAYDGRMLRIVEYSPPRVRGFFQGTSSHDRLPGATARKEVALEIVDEDGQTLFEFPKVQGVIDLFDTVKLQLLDVEGFIKSLAARG